MPRIRIERKTSPAADGGAYFPPELDIEFIQSGSTLLDFVNGGGWAVGRIVNVVGDSSTGKTQLVIEAAANYVRQFPKGALRYVDAEHAFDERYAQFIGFPKTCKPRHKIRTAEAFANDVWNWVEAQPKGGSGLYMLDSLDALTDDAELASEFGAATFGTGKPKMMSKFFRQLTSMLAEKRCTLLIVSQLRDNFQAMYGEKSVRAGGRALDFYASQIVWLSHLKKLEAQRSGVKRAIGVLVMARNKKNKCGVPFQTCNYRLHFNFGIDDVASMLDWLIEAHMWKIIGTEKATRALLSESAAMNSEEWCKTRLMLRKRLREVWHQLDVEFMPTRVKYPPKAK